MGLPKAVTIAGSDTSGGAGIQADLKTFQERNVYGMSAVTTIVTMDPNNHWNHLVFPQETATVKAQLDTLFSVNIDALKTGMLGSVEIIELVADTIQTHGIKNVVVDPVMVCKGNDEVLHPETSVALRDVLVPVATIATPNLFEASQLAQMPPLKGIDDMKKAAEKIHALGPKYVLIKGGQNKADGRATDLLYDGTTFEMFEADRVATSYTHGAGCTYSAAITAELARGAAIKEAIETAKDFITAAIQHGFKLNEYVGPTMHSAYRNK
ncbi:pyridoxine/pyridoxal/pyridoxamine kinase [Bacillaceae bacterium SIJ1]|uniref:pyridoxine/pyridoxal/pyridoxamine kinase n=1 Tax=Litoribacterium kuwaitense TaxID=1398745 RepID=UPI0013EDEE4F|nr:pyridoxine/pyridoxal/pyridoxamine kinase [Litoribacterium kuwaitense]NGP43927.1 pyridoxine/pyridoxal/pyridoxamine kinase [Litoribacterium kuwaitense]